MTLRPYLGRIGLLALAALLVGLSAVFGAGLLTDRPAEAAVERIYTLPRKRTRKLLRREEG
jgi:Tfp pilus assembly protein PilN